LIEIDADEEEKIACFFFVYFFMFRLIQIGLV